MQKLIIGVVFGGKSGEHEVSLVSASSVIKALAPEKYEVVEIGIDHQGRWYSGANCLEAFKQHDYSKLKPVTLGTQSEIYLDGAKQPIDVFFPVLHGPFGEDGTIQGMFEMMGAAYVGCGVMASATAMDKVQCKLIWEAQGLPVVPYQVHTRRNWRADREKIEKEIAAGLGFPCFIKPANMGSSVGVSKVKTYEELGQAMDLACEFDGKILVEQGLDVREIECAVLGNEEPVASPVGEVIVGGEFYDFNDKYVNGVSSTVIPADVDEGMMEEIRQLSLKAYRVLDCSGLARVDSFVDRKTDKVYLNEINTLPGFTSISMYPKMMQAYGLEYPDLVDRLIRLGMERFEERSSNRVAFESGSNWFQQ